jgi:5'-nucleotidase
VPAERAIPELRSRFDARRGTLEWYCVDHWSAELDFDIAALKLEMRGHIRYLPGALEFLDRVRTLGKRLLLTTNAHPISLAIKKEQAGLDRHFDELVSSHEFGVPKESPEFWIRLARGHGVLASSTLFVDDSAAVLAAAREAGVRWLYQVLQPDSTLPAHAASPGVAGIHALADLTP